MNNDELKAIGCTSIEDLIAEDFGTLGTEERNAFEASCEAFIIRLALSISPGGVF